MNQPTQLKAPIQKIEVIDLKALKWLINNYNTLEIDRPANQSLKQLENQKYTDLDILKRMLGNCRKNGTLRTEYKQGGNKNRGRYYVTRGIGLSALMRELRAVLARDSYYDVDIVNCDPVLLLQFCEKNIPEVTITQLKNYVNNRGNLLNELMTKYNITRSDAKQIILTISKGGYSQYNKLDDKPQWLVDLKDEFKAIGQAVMTKFEDDKKYTQMKKPKPFCVWGSLVSLLIQDVENDVIQHLDRYLSSQNYSVDTLIFDGVLVRKTKPLNQDILNQASSYIKDKTGYSVTFAIKPFDETIKVPSNLLTNDEVYGEIKKEFEKDICKIITPVQFLNLKKYHAKHTYDEEQDHEIDYMNKKSLLDAYEDYNEWKGTTITGGRTPKNFIENWLKDTSKACYDRLDFLPSPIHCPATTFNTYRGLDIESVCNGVYKQEHVDTIRNHISFLVDHDKPSIAYLEAFFAQLVQQPGRLSKVAIVLKSRQGCGKNLLLDIIASMIGHKYYISTANHASTLPKHTNC